MFIGPTRDQDLLSQSGPMNLVFFVTSFGLKRSRHLPIAGLSIGLRPANETGRYFVTKCLIGWIQAYNQLYYSICTHDPAISEQDCNKLHSGALMLNSFIGFTKPQLTHSGPDKRAGILQKKYENCCILIEISRKWTAWRPTWRPSHYLTQRKPSYWRIYASPKE